MISIYLLLDCAVCRIPGIIHYILSKCLVLFFLEKKDNFANDRVLTCKMSVL